MSTTADQPPSGMPATAAHDGSVRTRWGWTEPAVWTERMLTALERGVHGGHWFSLMDKVYARRNLLAAFAKVAANDGTPGVDHQTVRSYADHLDANLEHLEQSLRAGTFRPQAVRRVMIPKPDGGERPLGIPTVQDRVVQGALRHVLEPIFENEFATHSYGFRPQRGCKDALRRVDELLKSGHRYVVDADLKSYFDTIPHERLLALLAQRVIDGKVLALVRAYLQQGIFDGLREWTPAQGTPQGAVMSPLLANIYLNPLDHLLAGRGYEMVRYADDFVVMCRSRREAEQALALIQEWVQAAGLTLHPTKTRIAHAYYDGFEFLGYRFERGQHRPREKSLAKLKDAVRQKTRRTDGRSLACIIADVSRTLRGWFGYFRHSRRTVFAPLDCWVRMRLRSILRRRHGGRGCGRGLDHQHWPTAYFVQQGLFTLQTAHTLACQSPSG